MGMEKLNVVYILGLGFSGSTLLSFVLNNHPEIFTVGEVGPGPEIQQKQFPCSCGKILAECVFWTKIQEKMKRSYSVSLDLDSLDMHYVFSRNKFFETLLMGRLKTHYLWQLRNTILHPIFPGFQKRISYLNRKNYFFMKTALEISNSNCFLDATKNWNRLFYLSKIKEINLKVIHLVRSPYGFSASAKKRLNWDVYLGAQSWSKQTHDNIFILKKYIPPECQFVLAYENFCENPSAVLNKLIEFIGVAPMGFPVNFRDYEHHIIGNKMRNASSEKRDTVVLDEKWKTILSEREKAIVTQIAFPFATQFHYKPC